MSRGRAGVAAGHPLVAETVAEVLTAGGNAYDGVIAGLAMACVAEPVLASLGGGGFAVTLPADKSPRAYDFFAHCPQQPPNPVTSGDFRPIMVEFGTETQEFNIGWGTTAVPGVVAGIFAMHHDLASMPLPELFAPAVKQAKSGVVVNDEQGYFFELTEPIFMNSAVSRAIYESRRISGRVVQAGETLRQVKLANAMEVLAIEGRDLFYRGEFAQALLDSAGLRTPLTAADLRDYECLCREPLMVEFERARVYLNPPPAAGGMLVAFGLRLLDGSGIAQLPMGSSARIRTLATALQGTAEARVHARAHEDALAAQSDGEKVLSPELLQEWRARVQQRAIVRAGTTQISVADNVGNVVALTVSNGSGSGQIIPGTGIAMNNMLGEMDVNPGGVREWPCGARLSSMMAPSVVHWPDGRKAATGSGGSSRIRSAVLQVLVNLIANQLDVTAAVAAPRLHMEGERLSVEHGFDPAEIADILVEWPDHRVWEARNMFFGGVHTVTVGQDFVDAVGDARRGGRAITV